MGESAGFWQEGQQAWDRLARWRQDAPARTPQAGDEGDRALQALTDIGAVRRLLDQAEFDAIRTGRRQGRSWAEIGVRLGITRQSAWERWQEVDEPERPRSTRGGSRRDAELPGQVPVPTAGPADADVLRALGERAVGALAMVPDVIGMSWDDARRALRQALLVVAWSDLDGPPPPPALGRSDGVVVDQSPEAGATVPRGSTVTLWVQRGGGSGVREPRRPKPDPKTGRKMWDAIADEAVG